MTKPQQRLDYNFELVWREEEPEFIVGFGEGEQRRQKNDIAISSIFADSESEDDDDESSGILSKGGQKENSPLAFLKGDVSSGDSFLFDFFSTTCSSPKQQLAYRHDDEKDAVVDYVVTPDTIKERRKSIPIVTPPTAQSTPFSCSSDATSPGCPLSSSSQDTYKKDADIILNNPSDDLMNAFPSCSSMNSVAKKLFHDRDDYYLDKTPIKISDQRSSLNLPEDYGPIRREIPWSSGSSETTTDHASNVTFAKLASTIISSQGSRKTVVEPLDRIATMLESKGVGRGTAGIQNIRALSTIRLFIDDYSEANFWSLLDSLYFNLNIRKLILFRRRQCDRSLVRTQQEMDCLFRVVNRLASSLSEIHLWGCNPEDQGVLSRGLANNASLEYVQLHFETGSLSTMFSKALASLPNLVSLEVDVKESFQLSLLLDSPSLGVLSVICPESARFTFPDEEMVRFCEKLEENKNLQVLSIEPLISVTVALPALMGVLKRKKNRTLQTLQFSSAPPKNQDDALLPILRSLNKTSLRVLWNHCYESWNVSPSVQQKLLRILNLNRTLEQCQVFAESNDYWREKCSILERNVCP